MDWNNKKILVNGATGFIGSNLVEELLKRGAIIYAIDNLNQVSDWVILSEKRWKK